jgi:hypothetical protein
VNLPRAAAITGTVAAATAVAIVTTAIPAAASSDTYYDSDQGRRVWVYLTWTDLGSSIRLDRACVTSTDHNFTRLKNLTIKGYSFPNISPGVCTAVGFKVPDPTSVKITGTADYSLAPDFFFSDTETVG